MRKLNNASRRHFEIAFRMFDLNGDGDVDCEEFEKVAALIRQQSSIGSRHRDHANTGNTFKGINSALTTYFFGSKLNQKLTIEKFLDFQQQLQKEILSLEFQRKQPDENGRITEADFAELLLAYAGYPAKKKARMLKRVKKAPRCATWRAPWPTWTCSRISSTWCSPYSTRTVSGCCFILTFYHIAGASIDQPTLRHVARTVAHVDLLPHLVNVVFTIFDENSEWLLLHFDVLPHRGRVHRPAHAAPRGAHRGPRGPAARISSTWCSPYSTRTVSGCCFILTFYHIAGASIDQPTLRHVARTVAHVDLLPHLVNVVFTIFDENSEWLLLHFDVLPHRGRVHRPAHAAPRGAHRGPRGPAAASRQRGVHHIRREHPRCATWRAPWPTWTCSRISSTWCSPYSTRTVSGCCFILTFYHIAGASIDQPTLRHVARTVAHVDLLPHLVNVVFTIFDENSEWLLLHFDVLPHRGRVHRPAHAAPRGAHRGPRGPAARISSTWCSPYSTRTVSGCCFILTFYHRAVHRPLRLATCTVMDLLPFNKPRLPPTNLDTWTCKHLVNVGLANTIRTVSGCCFILTGPLEKLTITICATSEPGQWTPHPINVVVPIFDDK
ncbi:hypothetical protein ACJJTC_019667 [Scirpophaga incertulas]